MNAEKVFKCQLVIKMGYNKLNLLTNEIGNKTSLENYQHEELDKFHS